MTSMGELPEKEVLKALDQTANLCNQLGHEIIETKAPDLKGKAISDAFFTVAGSVMNGVAKMMEGMIGPINDTHLEPFTLSLIEWYRGLPADTLEKSRKVFQEAKKTMIDFVRQFDVMLCPTLPILPQRLGYLSPHLDREELIHRMDYYAGFTAIHNVAGLPAMSVPLYITESGLPVGSHFSASIGDEATLLGFAYQLEEASPWADRKPPHHGI